MYLRITGGTDNRRQISDWPRYTHKGDRSHKGWYMEKEWEYERDEKIVLIIYPIIDFFHRAEWSFSQSGETMNRRQGRGLNGATIFCFDSLFIFFFSFPPPFFSCSARRNSRCVSRNAIIPDDYVEHDNIISSYDHSFATGSGFIPARQGGLHDLLSKLNRDFALTLFSAPRVTRVHACAPMETHPLPFAHPSSWLTF